MTGEMKLKIVIRSQGPNYLCLCITPPSQFVHIMVRLPVEMEHVFQGIFIAFVHTLQLSLLLGLYSVMTRLTVLMVVMRISVILEMIQTELLNVIQNYAGIID